MVQNMITFGSWHIIFVCLGSIKAFTIWCTAEQQGRACSKPHSIVIDVCVPDSEVIDGSIVGRGVQSCCYCVSEG